MPVIKKYRIIADADLPGSIARDAEYIAADAAHVNAVNPHPQYLLIKTASKSLSGPLNYPANTWTSLGRFPGFSLGNLGAPAALVVAICFIKDVSVSYQQSNCGALLSPCWWVPNSYTGTGTRVPLESHTGPEFFVRIMADIFQQGERGLLFFPETAISIPSTGRVDIQVLKFF